MPQSLRPLPAENLRWIPPEPESPLHIEAIPDLELAKLVSGNLHAACQRPAPVLLTGPPGILRTLVLEAVLAGKAPARAPRDMGYLHDFNRPDQPRLLTLPAGEGSRFRRRLGRLAAFLGEQLAETLAAEPFRSRQKAMQQSLENRVEKLSRPLEKTLESEGIALVRLQHGPVSEIAMFPTVMDRPVPPEELQALEEQGQIDASFRERFEENRARFSEELAAVDAQARALWREGLESIARSRRREARRILKRVVEELFGNLAGPETRVWLRELFSQELDRQVDEHDAGTPVDPALLDVNLVRLVEPDAARPVVRVTLPDPVSLAGGVAGDAVRPAFRRVFAGHLAEADGGFLVLDAEQLVASPEAAETLRDFLRSGRAQPVGNGSCRPQSLQPDCRVVVVGESPDCKALLETVPGLESAFGSFLECPSSLPACESVTRLFAAALGQTAGRESTGEPEKGNDTAPPEPDPGFLEVLISEGYRRSARPGRVCLPGAWSDRLVDEAAELAVAVGEKQISTGRLRAALEARDSARRADRVARIAERLEHDPLLAVRGKTAGQLMTLAPGGKHPVTVPWRLCATAGPDRAGAGPESREQALLAGLIDHLFGSTATRALRLRTEAVSGPEEPPPAQVSPAASAVSTLGLLAGLGLRQDVAVVGSLDVQGHFLPVGPDRAGQAVEAWLATCSELGMTGEQGIVIPRADADGLDVSEEVVRACRNNRFLIYPADHLIRVLELLTGKAAGARTRGRYPETSVMGRAEARVLDTPQTPPEG